jgi:hypothetical protein
MSGYRPARFGPAGLYQLPVLHFRPEEVSGILEAVKLSACEPIQTDPTVLANILRDEVQFYFAAAGEKKDKPTKRQFSEYVAALDNALEKLYDTLGADRTQGLVAGVGASQPGQPYQRQVMLHHDWDAHRELLALVELASVHRGRRWFKLAHNLTPEISYGSFEPLEQAPNGLLVRALAGVDAIAGVIAAAQEALREMPDSRGGRPSPDELRDYLFGRLARLFFKIYEQEPESTKHGEEFRGTWHDWLRAILPKIGLRIRQLELEKHQEPSLSWAREPAYHWLRDKKHEKTE